MDNGSEEQAMESFFPILDAKSQCLKHLLRRYPYVSKTRARDCLPPLAVHGRAEPAKDDVEISESIRKQKHVKDWTAGFMFHFPHSTADVQLPMYSNQRWKSFDRRYDDYEGGPVLESLQPIHNPYELVEEPYYCPGFWTHFRNYGYCLQSSFSQMFYLGPPIKLMNHILPIGVTED